MIPKQNWGGGSENQSFEIFPINEDGENLNNVNITIKDTENNQFVFTEVPYKDFYKKYLGNIYAKFSKQTINGKRYKEKDILIKKENCYDGACFWGEVKGNNFISYEKLSKEVGLPYDEKHMLEIDKEEKTVGGIWLKFTDKKYKDKNGNVREFYIAKKPVLKSVSWNDLYKANVVYERDYQNIGYRRKIVKINGKKYVVRLLRGVSNYDGIISSIFIGFNYNDFVNDCHHSEWNRTMIPITEVFRDDASSLGMLENELKDVYKFFNGYKICTANYNWRMDLALGLEGQRNWMQESSIITKFESNAEEIFCITRGSDNAADCEGDDKFAPSSSFGWRPVLELIKE